MLNATRTIVLHPPGQNFRILGGQRLRVDPFQLDTPQAPVLGIEWTPVPDVLRDQIDLPPGGVVVETVVKDSLAERLGIAKHDVLVEIQGKPVSGSVDVRAALDAVKAGEKVTAVVVRKGLKKALEAVK
jgi:S1-C subfamily serine protease